MAKRKDNNGRVLRTGETQRKNDGRYQYDYSDFSGKRRRIYADTLQELREREKQIERDLDAGIDFAKGNMTLNELFKIYISTKTNIRDTTRSHYLSLWDYAIADSVIGKMPINRLKQIHIKTFYIDKVTRLGLSESSIKKYQALIYPALELAVDSDWIRRNPSVGADKGIGAKKQKREALTRDEQAALMEFLQEDGNIYSCYYPMIVFMLATALRVSELCGLTWHDVDMKENVIHVQQQLLYKNLGNGCKYLVSDLKTDAGCRDIPLTSVAREALMQQRGIYRMTGKVFAQQEVEGVSDFVFTNKNGLPYTANLIDAILKNIVKAANKEEEQRAELEHREPVLLPHISAHILRHTGCSRLAEAGLDPKVLQTIMGHTNISTTMDIYVNMDFKQIQEQVNAVEAKVG